MVMKILLGKSISKWRLFGKFLKCFIIAVVVVAAIFANILYFNVYLPLGSGPAGPNVPNKPFSYIWSDQEVLLLGIGDSITDGFGATEGFSYFERLIKNPEGECEDMLGKNLSVVLPKLKAKNISVSGSVSLEHLGRIRSLKPQPTDVLGIVVMTTGGNDLIHEYGQKPPKECAMYGAILNQAQPWINNFEKRLDEMIIGIKEKFPGGCHIFLANIYDPSDGTGNTNTWFTGLPDWPDGLSILEAYNQIISNCADKYDFVHLVDIHKHFLGHGIYCRRFWNRNYQWSDPTYWYYLNIEDPSDRGYDAIRRLFLIEIAKVFFKNKSLKAIN